MWQLVKEDPPTTLHDTTGRTRCWENGGSQVICQTDLNSNVVVCGSDVSVQNGKML